MSDKPNYVVHEDADRPGRYFITEGVRVVADGIFDEGVAQRFALAPEMAEAILRYSKGGHRECGLVSCAACDFARLAEKLRDRSYLT